MGLEEGETEMTDREIRKITDDSRDKLRRKWNSKDNPSRGKVTTPNKYTEREGGRLTSYPRLFAVT